MITKERLEELIEQGATIYINNSYQTYELNMSCFVNIQIIDNILYCGSEIVPLENLFKTKEDARWELEMTATRTETLKLPNYKQVCDIIYSGSYGVLTIKDFDDVTFGYKRQIDNNVYLFINRQSKTLYLQSLTKENYIEACKLCLRLFKGEEYEK